MASKSIAFKEFVFSPALDLTASLIIDINDLFKSGDGGNYNLQKLNAINIQLFITGIKDRDGSDSLVLKRSNEYSALGTNYVEVPGSEKFLDNGTYPFDYDVAIFTNSKYYALVYTRSAISAGTIDKIEVTLKFE